MSLAANIEAVWKPIPNSSQELALDSRCQHTLYHGTRGPGKTATQLMRFRRFVGLGYGKFWKGVIFDVEHKNLDDLVTQSLRFFPLFEDGAKFSSSASSYKWTWPTGEQLLFRHIKKEDEYNKFHGHEYPFIGWNELTKYPTPVLYDNMCSTNRSSFVPEIHTPRKKNGEYNTPDGKPLPPIPLEVFSTTNPSGCGHNWVKKRFIDIAKNGEVVKVCTKVFSPQEKKLVVVEVTQVAIFGSYKENIYLPATYIANLTNATRKNKNLFKAWLMGSWDVTAGGAIDDLWDSNIHIIDRFRIPRNWYVDRSMDWGSGHPFSICWWAEANGEEAILPNGKKWCPEPGTLIQIFEWYGSENIGSNVGLGLSATEVAKGIKDREKLLRDNDWIKKKPKGGPADTKKGGNTDLTEETIEDKMIKYGIMWTTPNKSQGSRIQGLELLRNRLEASVKGEGPGIYFMRNCKASIETIPVLPRSTKDVEDVDTDAEDHAYDAVRYRVSKDRHRVVTGGSYY